MSNKINKAVIEKVDPECNDWLGENHEQDKELFYNITA
tara:strand:- start:774 stop:887 length:114 start_codon:yes stop_codon:yes gene_type:complete